MGAAAVFLVVAVASIRALGGIDFRPSFLVFGALLTPILQLGNAAEYRMLGRLVEQKVGWWEALEITTLATAANLLPIPGGALLKIREMGGRSGSIPFTALATALIGAFWLGAACALAAVGLLLLGRNAAAITFAGFAVLTLILGLLLAPRRQGLGARALVPLGVIEAVLVVTAAGRIALVMEGIGIESSVSLAMVFAASGPMAAVFGFFPGGLGLQELIAGALAPVAAVGPEVGAASVAVDRLLGYTAMAVGAGAIWLGAKHLRRPGRA
jgi:hypothetical protein